MIRVSVRVFHVEHSSRDLAGIGVHMNKQQRKEITALAAAVQVIFAAAHELATAEPAPTKEALAADVKKVYEALDGLRDATEQMGSDEQDKFDNMSEGLQGSPTGEAIEQAIENLDSITSSIDTLRDKFDFPESGGAWDDAKMDDIDWDEAADDMQTICDELDAL